MTRIWLGVALAAALLVGGWFAYNRAYNAGLEAGQSAVRAEWAEANSKAMQAAGEALRAELARREEIEHGLEAKLDSADRRGRDLARRLRNALAADCPLPQAPATPGEADGTGGVAANPRAVDEALDAHLAACERDATRLEKLQEFLTSD